MSEPNAAANPVNWPATQIETRKLADLRPHPQNSRTHSAEQIKQVAKAMRQWGWTIPMLIDEDDFILAGHCRQLAARRNGYTDAPCMVARGWSDEQKRAYIIADNKLTENGGWDKDILGGELASLEMNFDLDLLGFKDKELSKLLGYGDASGDAETNQVGDMKFAVVIDCQNEEHQAEILAKLEQDGIPCRALIS